MIGVLGASGAVGRWAAQALLARGRPELRLGARRPDELARVRDGLLAGTGDVSRVEISLVDVSDPGSLAGFCAGCALVLNCAGPSYRVQDTVAAAALAAGAHYVDVAGDDPAREGLLRRGFGGTDRVVLLSAGTLPGLSSIVPRWLAGHAPAEPRSLTAYAGGVEPCSPVVAQDMLLSLTTGGADGAAFGEPLAAWRDGQRRSRALRVVEDADVPFFPAPVALQPFLSTETVRLAEALCLTDVDWFNVHPGPQVRALLHQLPAYAQQGADPDRLGQRMMQAAELDLAGRDPYYRMVFTLGLAGGSSRTVALLASSSYRLTGLVGALAALAVADGRVPSGLHFAPDVLDPDELVAAVRDSGALAGFTTVDGDPATEEEGAL